MYYGQLVWAVSLGGAVAEKAWGLQHGFHTEESIRSRESPWSHCLVLSSCVSFRFFQQCDVIVTVLSLQS